MSTLNLDPETDRSRPDTKGDRPRIGSSVLLAVVTAIVVIVGLLLTLVLLTGGSTVRTEVLMGVSAILGVAVVALILFIMAIAYSSLNLADPRQALGLPEGSIRALIALFLIMIFLVMSIFLFRAVGFGFYGPTMENVLRSDLAEIGDRIGRIELNEDGTYNVTLYIPLTSEGNQLALQLLTILGTLVTAVSAFYFGASSTHSDAGRGRVLASGGDVGQGLAPVIDRIDPQSAAQGSNVTLTLFGRNFQAPRVVRLVRDAETMVGSNIRATDTEIKCDIAVDKQQGNPWNVVLVNENGQAFELVDAFRIV